MTQHEYKQLQLQRKADQLFAACLQYLIAQEDSFLLTISSLSAELLAEGYESSFQKRALVVRSTFNNLTQLIITEQAELDKLNPRAIDLEALPHAER